jgi:tRNA pseudouridine38-40 synthase
MATPKTTTASRWDRDAPVLVGRLKMTVAYDGRPFRGWQSESGGNGVQDHMQRALEVLCRRPVDVQGSGRTDAGVHALAQVAHADVDSRRFPLGQWREAINAHLPPEIRVIRCTRVPKTFHARYSAVGKIYRYQIWNDRVFPPLEIGRCWHVHKPLDAARLEEHAQLLVGTHDFAAFAANRGFKEKSTVRTIEEVKMRVRGKRIALEFRGNGFLYHQVRLMAGGLVRANLPEARPDDIPWRLATGAPAKCQHAAPASGLYLVRVLY